MEILRNIPINRKFINKLNDFNQEIKHVFDPYILINNVGVVTTLPGGVGDKVSKGSRICITPYSFNFDAYSEYPPVIRSLLLKSDVIFNAIKNHKKEIESVLIDTDMNLYFAGSKTTDVICKFGTVDNNISRETPNTISRDDYSAEALSNKSHIYELPDDTAKKLVSNAVISLDKPVDDIELVPRITKELLPGVKKGDRVFYYFDDLSNFTYGLTLIYARESTGFTMIGKYTMLRA